MLLINFGFSSSIFLVKVNDNLQVIQSSVNLLETISPHFLVSDLFELFFSNFGVIPKILSCCFALLEFYFSKFTIDVKDASLTHPGDHPML
jgi:hypothetical protein